MHLVWLGYFGFWGLLTPRRPPTRMYGVRLVHKSLLKALYTYVGIYYFDL